MSFMLNLLHNIWLVFLDTAFWLLLGLIAAGLVKAYIPANAMQRWLGGRGLSAITRATLFGAPLPLCSCGVLPAALGLRRSGASKEATVAFLIATPETSIDSVAVTYALLGPVMAVYRPLAALVTAVVAGLLTAWVDDEPATVVPTQTVACSGNTGCCAGKTPARETSCCAPQTTDCCAKPVVPAARWLQAVKFAGGELLDDISKWLAIGIVIAGVIATVIPPGWLAQWGGGLPAMLVMLAVGIPMYICATASTPVAAGLLLAGVSPGTVLVFLLAGPA
ncbi:MAG TPA: SO_0444 family Cu/Zn efflux transporter, partial [Gammaproteobacteria bacterium]|nr:SO_0444 family Cu/Zn efflux transporter [Gammaproteobacteria bacterium]